jgi:type III secretion protein D
MSRTLELRILTGLHRGARCAVQDGATIGSHAECDIVLADAGVAARAAAVHIGPDAWYLRLTEDDADAGAPLPFNVAGVIGTVGLTVSTVEAPWPEHAETPSAEPPAVHAATFASDGPPPWTGRRSGDLSGPLAMREGRRAGTLWAIAGILVVLVFGGGAVASFSPSGTRGDLQRSAPPSTLAEALDATRRAVHQLGLQERVSAHLSDDQQVWVTGWVRDEAEHDRLATTLASIWPGPTLKVDNQARMSDKIVSLVRDLDVRVAVEYAGAGPFMIRGIAASEAARDEALARWASVVDGYESGTARLMLVSEAKAALQATAAQADLGNISIDWSDRKFIIGATGFDETRRARLKSFVDTVNGTYLYALVVADSPKPPQAAVPFPIHSVISGDAPWLMLEDGTKVVVGGTYGGYRLTAIEDGSITFEGPNTAVIPR